MIALRMTAPFSITTSGMMTLSVISAPLPTEQPVEMMEWLIEPSMLQPSATKLSRISADLEMKLDGMAWFLA